MTTNKLVCTTCLALALSACAGELAGGPGESRDAPGSDAVTVDEVDAQDESSAADGAASAPEVELTSDDMVTGAVRQDIPGCLTFYTAEEGSGSLFEGSLQAATTTPRLVYLNRTGGTYTRGRNDSSKNTSSIPNRTVQVAGYEGSEAEWQSIVSCVKDQFAAYNVSVTDQDPGAAAHIEAVVGDGPQAVDLSAGVGGVSPFTCGVIERSIVYVFSKVLRGARQECEVIAHEVGHSMGLEHEYLCQDPMTYLNGCGQKTFQDVAASCGTSSAVSCECGSPTQNTVQKLLTNVGPALGEPDPDPIDPPPPGTDAAPAVSLISPSDGATLPGNSDLIVTVQATDDKGVSDVRLLWEFQGTRTLSCRDAQAPVTCTVQGDRYSFRLAVGTGPRAFTAEAVDSAGQTARSRRAQITLTTAQADAAPTVALTAPSANSTVQRGSRFAIRANASDDRAVREVSLNWTSATGTQTFRLDNLGSGVYGLDLSLSASARAGLRTLSVTATDDAGQTTTSAPVSITVR